jgi:hypothetical protein
VVWGLEDGTVFRDRNDLGVIRDFQGGFVDDKDRWDLHPKCRKDGEWQDEIDSTLSGDITYAAKDG